MSNSLADLVILKLSAKVHCCQVVYAWVHNAYMYMQAYSILFLVCMRFYVLHDFVINLLHTMFNGRWPESEQASILSRRVKYRPTERRSLFQERGS